MKKVVLKLNLHDDKVKQKAMKKVSGLPGIESISMDMKDKKLTVTGDIDPVNVVGKLRTICHTEIVSVGFAKDDYKRDDKKKDDKKKQEEKKYDNMKKDDQQNYQHFGPEFVYAYYPPQYMNNKYYARSAEEDPNSCVYKQWVCDKCSKGYAIHSDYEAHLKTCGDSWVGSFTEHQDACTVRGSQPDHHPPIQLQVHHSMCTELKKLVDRIAAIFPDIEAALPRCDSGIQSLCLLKSAMDKAKQLLEYCLESSKLYLALTGDAILSRCRKSKNLLEQSLCQVQTMIPVKSAEISHIIDDLRATRFMLDSSEEEARKALLDLLLCRDTAAPDALASNEKKALQLAASRLHMASKTAMSVEMRAIKKLLAEVGEKDRNKRKILNYLLLLLKKYGRSVAREQIDHRPVGESSDPILSGDHGIRISTGADAGFLNCRRLETFHLKTVDLPLLLIPSRSIALNLRAECLVKVYLPSSNDALVQDLVNLKELDLSCSSFTRIPDLSRACCTSLTCLPSLMALKFLLSLDVSDCINLRRLPPSLGCLSSLTALDLRNCKRIQNLPKGILKRKSVKTLLISGCSMLMEHASGPERMLIENQNPIAHSSLHALDEEVSMSYLPVDKYVSKIPLQQPEEERISSKCQSIASKDAVEPSSTTLDLERHKEVLKAYMNAPVEAIHQANAFYDIERTVDLLTRQSSNLHESASLHDLMCCLEELQENVPEIMSRMHDARVSKASIHVKSAQLLSSSVQSEGHYNGLAAQLSVISDEEEDLDAEIDRLLAKKRELLD